MLSSNQVKHSLNALLIAISVSSCSSQAIWSENIQNVIDLANLFRHSSNMARWSRGMILALGARGPGFKSRTDSDCLFPLFGTIIAISIACYIFPVTMTFLLQLNLS